MKKLVFSLFTVLSTLRLFATTDTGIASYYGTEFHGRPTASGEIYSQNKLTAAHKTLPLGTILKVTNLQNNKSVYVKVNDRGPFIKGRIIDVSTKAAELLGFRNKGTATVTIETVEDNSIPEDLMQATQDVALQHGIETTGSPTDAFRSFPDIAEASDSSRNLPAEQPPLTTVDISKAAINQRSPYFVVTKTNKANKGFYGLQLGIFSDVTAISALAEEIQVIYKETPVIQQIQQEGKTYYQLLVGKFQNRAYADAMKLALTDKYKDIQIVQYD